MNDEKPTCEHGETEEHPFRKEVSLGVAVSDWCTGPVVSAEPQEAVVSVNVVLAQSEYRLKLLFKEHGVAINTPFFEAVYRRIELTAGKLMQNASTQPATTASEAAGGSPETP